MHALLACCLIGALYIAPFYLQQHVPRSHPSAVLFRSLSACAACCATWVPLYYAVQVCTRDAHARLTAKGCSAGSGRQ